MLEEFSYKQNEKAPIKLSFTAPDHPVKSVPGKPLRAEEATAKSEGGQTTHAEGETKEKETIKGERGETGNYGTIVIEIDLETENDNGTEGENEAKKDNEKEKEKGKEKETGIETEKNEKGKQNGEKETEEQEKGNADAVESSRSKKVYENCILAMHRCTKIYEYYHRAIYAVSI